MGRVVWVNTALCPSASGAQPNTHCQGSRKPFCRTGFVPVLSELSDEGL